MKIPMLTKLNEQNHEPKSHIPLTNDLKTSAKSQNQPNETIRKEEFMFQKHNKQMFSFRCHNLTWSN